MTQPCKTWKDSDIVAAFEQAKQLAEPIFVPATIYADDRGWSVMNQMQGVLGPDGQLNYSVVFPYVVKAWHRHKKQTDFWFSPMGQMKAGIYRDEDDTSWSVIMGDKKPGVLIIPPTLWHGMTTVGPDPSGLLYFVTHAYDPANPDEERREFDSVPNFTWQVEHR